MPDDARDIDQPAEQLDDEVLGEEFPPERPLGLREDVDDEEPEDFGGLDEDEPEPDVEAGVAFDGEDEELHVPVVEDDDIGALAEDDDFTGDETTRDVATERVPPPSEDAAVHVEPEDRQNRW